MTRVPIAIVGMSCLYPGSKNPEELWQGIRDRKCFVKRIPPNKMRIDLFFDPTRSVMGKIHSDIAATIDEFEFPYNKFMIPPKELATVDWSQRAMLELTRQALEGMPRKPTEEEHRDTVIILGNSGLKALQDMGMFVRRREFLHLLKPYLMAKGWDEATYQEFFKEYSAILNTWIYPYAKSTAAIASIPASVTGRIATAFKFGGLQHIVDAACASSLAAMNLACGLLAKRQCKMAVSGGFDLVTDATVCTGFSLLGGLSPTHTTPFDKGANGLVLSEGAGVFILKRLDDALVDGDDILAVIRGIGSASDGRTKAMYAPDSRGIARAIKNALMDSSIDPSKVQYVEAHATSTQVGDAAEYDALASIYAPAHEKGAPLQVRSIKEQFGHSRAASGAANVIKVIKAMEAGIFPAQFSFHELNQNIQYRGSALQIQNTESEWSMVDGTRTAAVTSAGFGGIDYHLIIERSESYSLPEYAKRVVATVPAAIVGLNAILPSAASAEEAWENFRSRKDIFVEIPSDSKAWKLYGKEPDDPAPDLTHSKRQAGWPKFTFEPLRYKIVPNEADTLEDGQRLALTLVDGLIQRYARVFEGKEERTATVIGYMFNHRQVRIQPVIRFPEYAEAFRSTKGYKTLDKNEAEQWIEEIRKIIFEDSPPVKPSCLPGWMNNTLAGWISKTFNFTGPNYICDSACSSTFAALRAAMTELELGSADLVVTGGLNMGKGEENSAALTALGAIAKYDARPFDKEADGFLLGLGGAVFAIKRLPDALADGDEIFAVVEGIGGSSETSGKSLITSSVDGISLAIRRALLATGENPEDFAFVEAHGGGTDVGDIAEIRSFAEIFRKEPGDAMPVTAIKSHVGHLQGGSAAGGLLSAVLSLRNRGLPALRVLEDWRPQLAPFLDRARPLKDNVELPKTGPLVCGVNSMGLGGSNYFVVLRSEPKGMRYESAATHRATPQVTVQSRVNTPLPDSGIFLVHADTLDQLAQRLTELSESKHRLVLEADDPSTGVALACTYSDETSLRKKLGFAAKLIAKPESDSALAAQGVFVRRSPGR